MLAKAVARAEAAIRVKELTPLVMKVQQEPTLEKSAMIPKTSSTASEIAAIMYTISVHLLRVEYVLTASVNPLGTSRPSSDAVALTRVMFIALLA